MTILNTPIEINGMTLPDRIVMPPMATSKASEDGSVTEALCRYYGEKAKDECIGLIITHEAAESLLEQNKADLIGVGRAILKDSGWAKSAIQAITAER
ncbi:MAG: hypothetical protein LKF79_05070 [Solobacterium sp.]|jgi:2,4-dienoyl-CoA reductase-like NADH-dependent reductase (Old Yellow Enzyme family)|nr:hypothetical protein [Solobacterium sp.]MCH4223073.1 hypothetical protein [Solobacterium sp.]MCH4265994.1 hypothetical protein [Solobacterium sp.]